MLIDKPIVIGRGELTPTRAMVLMWLLVLIVGVSAAIDWVYDLKKGNASLMNEYSVGRLVVVRMLY